ncbi:hypothetical protein [Ferrimonas balearica]|uniref:hypothetical protein n=1 Tax=Ferrimonas balearica TaxID=44012 RepID=UPI001C57640B|nr:hypothetical protein [Ferrimonas balearica]MBW3163980.1 hypothetical protein [Ferrimonas balearica]
MRELHTDEIIQVHGNGPGEAAGAFGAAAGIGAAAFGSGWGALGVGVAFAASPIAVGAMIGLSLYAGYQMLQK